MESETMSVAGSEVSQSAKTVSGKSIAETIAGDLLDTKSCIQYAGCTTFNIYTIQCRTNELHRKFYDKEGYTEKEYVTRINEFAHAFKIDAVPATLLIIVS